MAARIQVVIDGRFNVEVGAAEPVHFSNDIFEGKILFYASDAPCASVDIAAGRTFELQVH